MSTQGLNGGAAVTESHPDPLDAQVAQLEEMLPALAAERAQIAAHLKEVTDREERIRAGIAALSGKKPKGGATVAAGAAQTGRPLGASTQNPPSQKLQDDVYAAIARAEEPPTVIELSDLVGVSRSAVDNTVRHLRRVERVRVFGVKRGADGRPAGNVFAVMP